MQAPLTTAPFPLAGGFACLNCAGAPNTSGVHDFRSMVSSEGGVWDIYASDLDVVQWTPNETLVVFVCGDQGTRGGGGGFAGLGAFPGTLVQWLQSYF